VSRIFFLYSFTASEASPQDIANFKSARLSTFIRLLHRSHQWPFQHFPRPHLRLSEHHRHPSAHSIPSRCLSACVHTSALSQPPSLWLHLQSFSVSEYLKTSNVRWEKEMFGTSIRALCESPAGISYVNLSSIIPSTCFHCRKSPSKTTETMKIMNTPDGCVRNRWLEEEERCSKGIFSLRWRRYVTIHVMIYSSFLSP
jgi:hypothetical protein